jgi:RNA polymerase sigma-70 factor (ECF subfamily)
MNVEDKIIAVELLKKNNSVFEALFTEYYNRLIRFAEGFVFDRDLCEDIVQNFFADLWANPQLIIREDSMKSYFYKSIQNRCFNQLRTYKIQDKHQLMYLESLINATKTDDYDDEDINKKISDAIGQLPKQMAIIFKMKYKDDLPYVNIAEELGITVNTVKTQLQRAKVKLKDYVKEKHSLTLFL